MSYKLTKDQARQVLKVRNKMIDAINGLIECGDIGLREMHDLKNSIEGWGENSLDSIFVFKPPKDSEDCPNHYADKVLKDDVNAYHYFQERE